MITAAVWSFRESTSTPRRSANTWYKVESSATKLSDRLTLQPTPAIRSNWSRWSTAAKNSTCGCNSLRLPWARIWQRFCRPRFTKLTTDRGSWSTFNIDVSSRLGAASVLWHSLRLDIIEHDANSSSSYAAASPWFLGPIWQKSAGNFDEFMWLLRVTVEWAECSDRVCCDWKAHWRATLWARFASTWRRSQVLENCWKSSWFCLRTSVI